MLSVSHRTTDRGVVVMAVLAAPGDTWGIDGPTFLFLYLVLAAGVLVAATRARRRIAGAGAGRTGAARYPAGGRDGWSGMDERVAGELSIRDDEGARAERVVRRHCHRRHHRKRGRALLGGPHGDAGVTGRKIIVDTYGGAAPHGGGAFSGKDPTKVDRSACYMARHVAKNVVAAGLAERCMVQLAYAIGVAEPVSVLIDTFGTGQVSDEKISELVRAHFKLTPRGIIEMLDLRRPIYRKTAAFGHFGRTEPEFTWERTDKAAALRADAGL